MFALQICIALPFHSDESSLRAMPTLFTDISDGYYRGFPQSGDTPCLLVVGVDLHFTTPLFFLSLLERTFRLVILSYLGTLMVDVASVGVTLFHSYLDAFEPTISLQKITLSLLRD